MSAARLQAGLAQAQQLVDRGMVLAGRRALYRWLPQASERVDVWRLLGELNDALTKSQRPWCAGEDPACPTRQQAALGAGQAWLAAARLGHSADLAERAAQAFMLAAAPNRAIAAWRVAQRFGPLRAHQWRSFAAAAAALDDAARQVEAYTALRRLEPTVLEHQVQLGLALQRQDPGAARTILTEAVAQQPDRPELLDALAHLATAAGDEHEARRRLEHLRHVAPQHPTAHRRYAALLVGRGHGDGALQALQQQLALGDDADSYVMLGMLAFAARAHPEAEAQATRALELAPGHPGALGLQAQVRAAVGDAEAVVAILGPAFERANDVIRPTKPPIAVTGSLQPEVSSKAALTRRFTVPALHALADAYRKVGDVTRARRVYWHLLQRDGGLAIATEGLQSLSLATSFASGAGADVAGPDRSAQPLEDTQQAQRQLRNRVRRYARTTAAALPSWDAPFNGPAGEIPRPSVADPGSDAQALAQHVTAYPSAAPWVWRTLRDDGRSWPSGDIARVRQAVHDAQLGVAAQTRGWLPPEDAVTIHVAAETSTGQPSPANSGHSRESGFTPEEAAAVVVTALKRGLTTFAGGRRDLPAQLAAPAHSDADLIVHARVRALDAGRRVAVDAWLDWELPQGNARDNKHTAVSFAGEAETWDLENLAHQALRTLLGSKLRLVPGWPSLPAAHQAAGRALLAQQRGDHVEARQQLRRALALDPGHTLARAALGVLDSAASQHTQVLVLDFDPVETLQPAFAAEHEAAASGAPTGVPLPLRPAPPSDLPFWYGAAWAQDLRARLAQMSGIQVIPQQQADVALARMGWAGTSAADDRWQFAQDPDALRALGQLTGAHLVVVGRYATALQPQSVAPGAVDSDAQRQGPPPPRPTGFGIAARILDARTGAQQDHGVLHWQAGQPSPQRVRKAVLARLVPAVTGPHLAGDPPAQPLGLPASPSDYAAWGQRLHRQRLVARARAWAGHEAQSAYDALRTTKRLPGSSLDATDRRIGLDLRYEDGPSGPLPGLVLHLTHLPVPAGSLTFILGMAGDTFGGLPSARDKVETRSRVFRLEGGLAYSARLVEWLGVGVSPGVAVTLGWERFVPAGVAPQTRASEGDLVLNLRPNLQFDVQLVEGVALVAAAGYTAQLFGNKPAAATQGTGLFADFGVRWRLSDQAARRWAASSRRGRRSGSGDAGADGDGGGGDGVGGMLRRSLGLAEGGTSEWHLGYRSTFLVPADLSTAEAFDGAVGRAHVLHTFLFGRDGPGNLPGLWYLSFMTAPSALEDAKGLTYVEGGYDATWRVLGRHRPWVNPFVRGRVGVSVVMGGDTRGESIPSDHRFGASAGLQGGVEVAPWEWGVLSLAVGRDWRLARSNVRMEGYTASLGFTVALAR